MHLKSLAIAGIAAFALLLPARAQAECCDHQKADMKCCDAAAAMQCCDKDINVLAQVAVDRQVTPLPAAKQYTEVWFQRATMVGKSILQGRYVIEHDNDRMARGEPCTHIYAYNDRAKPVATFHCTHLERDRANQNVVVLQSSADMVKMQEFQFAGESAAHGVPNVR